MDKNKETGEPALLFCSRRGLFLQVFFHRRVGGCKKGGGGGERWTKSV